MNTRELRSNRQRLLLYSMIAIPFLLYLFIIIAPLGTAVRYSLSEWNGVGDPKLIGLDNYKNLIADSNFWLVTKNTFIYMIYCTVGQVGIALIISLLLNGRALSLKRFHRAVIFFPVVMAPVVVGFVWKIVYNSNYGFLNAFLTAIGRESWIRNWLDDIDIILTTVSVPVIWQYIGLYMIILLSAITSVPQEVYECADLDGANGVQRTIFITMPLIWDTFKVAIILCASGTMKIYDHVYVLSNGGPGRSSMPLALYAYQQTFGFGNFGYGASVSVSILFFALLVSLVVQLIMGGRRK